MYKMKFTKKFTNFLLDIDINIKQGEILGITGHSGSGKSTILNIVAGILNADRGYLKDDNKVYFDIDKKINILPQNRKIAYIQQQDNLFKHMSIKQNILYGNKNCDYKFLAKMLKIENKLNCMPNELSGGQKQRVNIARMIAINPNIILFDEPFSAIDKTLKMEIREDIKNIIKKNNITSIFVSHDIEELQFISDRVIHLENGKLIYNKSPIVIAISGVKNSGKTTFIEKLIKKLTSDGEIVATIKHDGHEFIPDREGTDSYRHRKAGAKYNAVFSKNISMVIKNEDIKINELIQIFNKASIILVEGMKNSSLPKIEIVRYGNSSKPICNEKSLLAIATNIKDLQSKEIIIDINDINTACNVIFKFRERNKFNE